MSETPELPEGEFDLIYADPPWNYSNKADTDGRVEEKYELMNLEDIKALNIPSAQDCVLYLWTTAPKAREGFEVIDAWGFEYITQAVWDKKHPMGIGYWFGNEHEILYCARKGDASPPDPDIKHGSIFREKKREHSRKPEIVRSYLEKAHPEARKLELFSRDGKVGWEAWGKEVTEHPQNTLLNYNQNESLDAK